MIFLTSFSRGLSLLLLALCTTLWPAAGNAQTAPAPFDAEAALPNAPQVQPGLESTAPAAPAAPAYRYARVIEPGQTAATFTPGEKMIFSLRGAASPLNVVTSLYSAGYEQLTEGDPKYGNDSGAFGAKFGASMLRTASTKIFADGVFATAFHQDPRYYRIGSGSIWSRGLQSAREALVRRSDEGNEEFNSSGIAGRAAGAVLTLGYYPSASRKGSVVLSTFLVSIATDAGGDLVLEFMPDLARKFPILRKFEVQ